MRAAFDRQNLAVCQSCRQPADHQHIHDEADDQEGRKQPDEACVVGACAAECRLDSGATGKARCGDDTGAEPPAHHCWAESDGSTGSRFVCVWGGVLLSSSAREPTASFGAWPDRLWT